MKKNPFKMWGSWIGAIVYALGGMFSFAIALANGMGSSQPTGIQQIIIYIFGFPLIIFGKIFNNQTMPGNFGYFLAFFQVASGFLIGWGIETLIRKNKWFGLK